MIVVASTTVTWVPGLEGPKSTTVVPVRSVPVIVIFVPDDPEEGLILVMRGAGGGTPA